MAVSNADMLALARELPIPVPWDRNVFIDNLARQRRRPIRLMPSDTSAFTEGPCGLWLIFDDEDVILYDAGTSDYHIDQIVCHEVGHMVLGHRSHQGSTDKTPKLELFSKMLPDLDLTTIQNVLGRKSFADDQELDAENFAHTLMCASAKAGAEKSVMRSVFFRSR
ncbi:hypothetical protein MHAE_01380 [Mycobacterium haemophilum DSM 44634]|uniref:hypothetical protein n=1 Tax=Mycobacterium haemophilum TaxID=29311 RepID=UPI000655F36F|nr:hypothetical protein [Mycobacterium haemophilum]AKN16941.1 hypothetical protein B586_10910 [Mycobacterium haemophilum DSM 44634]MCV7340355.1 hypothetical protein [Mycobacterium haemophilum DSM 44634]